MGIPSVACVQLALATRPHVFEIVTGCLRGHALSPAKPGCCLGRSPSVLLVSRALYTCVCVSVLDRFITMAAAFPIDLTNYMTVRAAAVVLVL